MGTDELIWRKAVEERLEHIEIDIALIREAVQQIGQQVGQMAQQQQRENLGG